MMDDAWTACREQACEGRVVHGILVVAGDGEAEGIRTAIEALGYPLTGIVRSGEDALRDAKAHEPALVLMDLRLDANVVAVAREIRAAVDVPIVFVIDDPAPDTLTHVMEAEPSGVVVRPIRDAELRCTLEMARVRHEIERRLRGREQLLATTLRSIGEAVIATDAAETITFMNPSAERLTGWRADRAVGQPVDDVIRLLNEDTGRAVASPMHRSVVTGKSTFHGHHTVLVRSDGARRAITDSAAPIRDLRGQLLGGVMVMRNVSRTRRVETEQRHLTESLRTMAVVDELTGLHNRRGFRLLAEQELKRAHRLRQTRQLFFVDLDGLKGINDTFGHDAGDRAIRDAAVLLRHAFRTADIVARIGGDEFVVLCTDGTDHHGAAVARLEKSIQDYNTQSDRPTFTLALSTGSARFDPDASETIDDLLQRADHAMYQQKTRRKRRGIAKDASSPSHVSLPGRG